MFRAVVAAVVASAGLAGAAGVVADAGGAGPAVGESGLAPLPRVAGRPAGCLLCHGEMRGFSTTHRPERIGCSICHGGDPEARDAEAAHQEIYRVPGDLSNAARTCGFCHPELVRRVERSLMTRNSGLVAVDRFAFGEAATPDDTAHIATDLDPRRAADSHLQNLCAFCHLGRRKEQPGPPHEMARGGGCAACHVEYHLPRGPRTHPRLTPAPSSAHCFGCHNRSGRISTNYEGWHETTLDPEAVAAAASDSLRLLADGRVFARQPEDLHHRAGLECIDCHTSREVMGDGRIHQHAGEQVEIACADCHFHGPAATLGWAEVDAETRRVVRRRYGAAQPQRRFLRIAKSGRALNNAFLDAAGRPVLERKRGPGGAGERWPLAAPAESCSRAEHRRLSCAICHNSWAPQCIACHTQRGTGADWDEYVGLFLPEPPVLAEDQRDRRIVGAVPGMVMTLGLAAAADSAGGDPEQLRRAGKLRRLYAPTAPHTVQRKGRDCRSCHLSSLALGWGRGRLELPAEDPAGWRFTPEYEALADGLPADAWIPFGPPTGAPAQATRTWLRPLPPETRERVLRVGVCLQCHGPEQVRAPLAKCRRPASP